jgi:hypothetical protein
MRETFHGSDAGGTWDWRMAYDLMQAAAIQALLRGDGAAGDIATAKLLASRLLTETRRSEQQIRLQQFSTPLAFAALGGHRCPGCFRRPGRCDAFAQRDRSVSPAAPAGPLRRRGDGP